MKWGFVQGAPPLHIFHGSIFTDCSQYSCLTDAVLSGGMNDTQEFEVRVGEVASSLEVLLLT